MKNLRLFFAFVLSPLFPALIIAAFMEIFVRHQGMLHLANIFLTIGAYGLMLFIGLPLYVYLERKKLENMEAYVLGGAGGGSIIPIVMTLKEIGNLSSANSILLVIGMTYGALIGLAFWLIAKKSYNHLD